MSHYWLIESVIFNRPQEREDYGYSSMFRANCLCEFRDIGLRARKHLCERTHRLLNLFQRIEYSSNTQKGGGGEKEEEEEEEKKRIKTEGGRIEERGIEYSIIQSKIAERIFSPQRIKTPADPFPKLISRFELNDRSPPLRHESPEIKQAGGTTGTRAIIPRKICKTIKNTGDLGENATQKNLRSTTLVLFPFSGSPIYIYIYMVLQNGASLYERPRPFLPLLHHTFFAVTKLDGG